MSVRKQLKALGLSRSSYYYKQRPMSDFNQMLMRRIDEIFTESPDSGSRMICRILRKEFKNKKQINRKRIQNLMRIMGIQAIFPGRHLRRAGKGSEHKIYPYLLRNRTITRPNEVWSTDITYIGLEHGLVYLVAIMDWFSRRILSWEVSTSMDKGFCLSALNRAIRLYGVPDIFNSDQGASSATRSRLIYCRKTTLSIRGNSIMTSVDGNVWVRKLMRQCGSSHSLKWE